MAVTSRQFSRQNTLFLENNRALSKFSYGVLHYLFVLSNYKKSQLIKPNFISRSFLITIKRLTKFIIEI